MVVHASSAYPIVLTVALGSGIIISSYLTAAADSDARHPDNSTELMVFLQLVPCRAAHYSLFLIVLILLQSCEMLGVDFTFLAAECCQSSAKHI